MTDKPNTPVQTDTMGQSAAKCSCMPFSRPLTATTDRKHCPVHGDATANATPEIRADCNKCGHLLIHHSKNNGCTHYVEKIGAECGCSGPTPDLRKPSVEAEGQYPPHTPECSYWEQNVCNCIHDSSSGDIPANPAPDAEVGEAVEITRLRTIVSVSQMGRIQKTHASELLSELRVLLAAYDALKAAQGELRGASITVAFRHRLAQLFHLKLAAAQNLEYEDGDTCSDCNSAVNDELLPILIEHGLINGDATANPEAAQQQAVDSMQERAALVAENYASRVLVHMKSEEREAIRSFFNGMVSVAEEIRALPPNQTPPSTDPRGEKLGTIIYNREKETVRYEKVCTVCHGYPEAAAHCLHCNRTGIEPPTPPSTEREI